MQNFRLRLNDNHYNLETPVIFSGGEVHVDISHLPVSCDDYNLKARLQSSDDIMHFIMLCDALGRRYPKAVSSVTVPYLPYARQDRMCAEGQHFGLIQMTKLLGSIPQHEFITYDLHSKVAEDLLYLQFGERLHHVTQAEILLNSELYSKISNGDLQLVSPDKGALRKVSEVALLCKPPIEPAVW